MKAFEVFQTLRSLSSHWKSYEVLRKKMKAHRGKSLEVFEVLKSAVSPLTSHEIKSCLACFFLKITLFLVYPNYIDKLISFVLNERQLNFIAKNVRFRSTCSCLFLVLTKISFHASNVFLLDAQHPRAEFLFLSYPKNMLFQKFQIPSKIENADI